MNTLISKILNFLKLKLVYCNLCKCKGHASFECWKSFEARIKLD